MDAQQLHELHARFKHLSRDQSAYWRREALQALCEADDLLKVSILNEENDKEAFGYLEDARAKYLAGIAAGLAVAATDGDEVAAAFMANLRGPPVPSPGEVLGLAPKLLLHPDYNSIYIRGCYPRLVDIILRTKRVVVTGTPGIGKSFLLYYLLSRLLHEESPPPFIFWEHMKLPGTVWCYDHSTGKVVYGPRSKLLFSAGFKLDQRSWYIADGVSPCYPLDMRTVLLTSPKRETYKDMEKGGAQMLYMPPWSLAELLACRRVLYRGVDEALAVQLFEHWGGVARDVLEHPCMKPEANLEQLLSELRKAVDYCNAEQAKLAVGALEIAPEASHRLLHIVVDESTFSQEGIVFASAWVEEQLVAKWQKEASMGLASLVEGTTGAQRGMLFEAVMHVRLPKGGTFKARPLSVGDCTKDVAEVDLELPSLSCNEVQTFLGAVSKLKLKDNVYYRPASKNFGTADAFLRVGDTVNVFQVTVQSFKEVHADRLEKVLEFVEVPEEGELTPRLIYVVPPDIYDVGFRLRKGKGKAWPPEAESHPRAKRAQLYVMRAPYA